MSCFWRTNIVCFTSFKDQFNPRKWIKSLKVKNFEVVNSAICAMFTLCHFKNLAAGCWSDFPPENFYFEIFSKTNAVSVTFGLRYIRGQSLKEINFPTRNVRGDFFMVVIVYFYNYYRYRFIYLFLFFFLQIWCIYGIYGYEYNKVVQCSQCNALLIDCCLCFSNIQTQRWLHGWVVYVVDVLFSMVRGSVKERGSLVLFKLTKCNHP